MTTDVCLDFLLLGVVSESGVSVRMKHNSQGTTYSLGTLRSLGSKTWQQTH